MSVSRTLRSIDSFSLICESVSSRRFSSSLHRTAPSRSSRGRQIQTAIATATAEDENETEKHEAVGERRKRPHRRNSTSGDFYIWADLLQRGARNSRGRTKAKTHRCFTPTQRMNLSLRAIKHQPSKAGTYHSPFLLPTYGHFLDITPAMQRSICAD